ncbi:hypothetical protein CBM2637_A60157 [Cupriavidus taiwanensis]|nr:hypothetical protein CBM2637_A60157 [Cupriavidus taiwanensis]
MFRDITPLLQDPKTLRVLIDVFVHRYMDAQLDLVAGIDARGFILGAIGRVRTEPRLRADPQEGQAAVPDRGRGIRA